MPEGAAAAWMTINVNARLTVIAMALPGRVQLTGLLAGPVLPPVAVNICVRCALTVHDALPISVTEQVPAGLTRQVLADSEYGALTPVRLSVTAVLPLFV